MKRRASSFQPKEGGFELVWAEFAVHTQGIPIPKKHLAPDYYESRQEGVKAVYGKNRKHRK